MFGRRRPGRWFFALNALVWSLILFGVMGRCPNGCSGHGHCDSAGRCSCYVDRTMSSRARPLWTGYDCSLRACPYGLAWGDVSSRTPFVRDPVLFVGASGGSSVSALVATLPHRLLHPASFDLEVQVLSRDTSMTGTMAYRLVGEPSIGAPHAFDFGSGEGTTAAMSLEIKAWRNGIRKPTGLYIWFDETLLGGDYTNGIAAGDRYFVNVSSGLPAGGPSWDGADLSTLHQRVECSGRGECDRTSGTCRCSPGFDGVACQRLECPNSCSGHGMCQTEHQLARAAAREAGLSPPATATWPEDLEASSVTGASYRLAYDAEKSAGCVCDQGFRGADCSERECPSSTDPLGGPGGPEGRDCSGRGTCNEKTGECDCFEGFTGSACHVISNFV